MITKRRRKVWPLLIGSVICLGIIAWLIDFYSYERWEGQKTTIVDQKMFFNGEAVPILGTSCKKEYQYTNAHRTCIIMLQVSPQNIGASLVGGIERIELVFTNSNHYSANDVIDIRFFSRTNNGALSFDEPVVLVVDEIKQELKIEGDLEKPWLRHPPDSSNTNAYTVMQYGGYKEARYSEFNFYVNYPHAKFGLGVNMGEVSTNKKISLHIPAIVNGVPIEMEFGFESETFIKKIKNSYGVPGMP